MKQPKYMTPKELRNLFLIRGITSVNENETRDIDKIKEIGYYKLKEFAYPFAKYDDKGNIFYHDLKFKKLLVRYYQDKNLRMNVLYAIEDIEVYLNNLVSSILGNDKYGPFGYLNFSNWCDRSISKFTIEKNQFNFKNDLLKKLNRSNLRDIKDKSNQNEDGFPTIWTMIDCLTFGDTKHLIMLMSKNNKKRISEKFECTPTELISWLNCLNFVRNVCVHNSDLLDIKIKTKPIPPKKYKRLLFKYDNNGGLNYTNRVAIVISIIKTMMSSVNPKYKFNSIKESFVKIISDDNNHSLNNAKYLGFNDVESYKIMLKNRNPKR